MAYMSQEKKKELAPRIKKVLEKYGIKGSLGVHHHSTLVLKIKSGKIDFVQDYNETMQSKPYGLPNYWQPAKDHIDINTYRYKDNHSGEALKFLSELLPIMNEGNWDKSDIMTDYFNVGWYVSVHVGDYSKPYEVTK